MLAVSEIVVNGARLEAHLSGALWWREREMVIVADLHLEKGSSFAGRGNLLPPYDSRETLSRLAALIRQFRPRQVVALGDSFHDAEAPLRLAAEDGECLRQLTGLTQWIWISGNHDPAPPDGFGGDVVPELTVGPLVFRHAALPERERAAGEVSGHYHPKISLLVRDRRISGRCFVTDGDRLILPAFGAYTGGLDVRDPAIRRLLGKAADAHVLGSARIVRLPLKGLAD